MRKELKDKIIAYNNRYEQINTELAKYDMYLVSETIFKGRIPYARYMGHMDDYEKIIQENWMK